MRLLGHPIARDLCRGRSPHVARYRTINIKRLAKYCISESAQSADGRELDASRLIDHKLSATVIWLMGGYFENGKRLPLVIASAIR